MVAVPSIGRADQPTPQHGAPEADATRRLYEQYARQIYAYCFHQLGSREEAEDATQSTFLNAFRGFQRGIDPEFESAWLYKIAQNVCLTRQRSSSRRRRVETAADLEAMQDVVPAREVDSDDLFGLPQALEGMPEQQRRALLLREWQGLSYKEISDELGISQGAVETLLFRARRTLAAGLTEEPKAGLAKRLRGGDAGSLFAVLKSLLVTGGAKVAATVATVAATSVVAATPAARHAVESAVTFSNVVHHAPKPAAVAKTPSLLQPTAVRPGAIGGSSAAQLFVPVAAAAAPAASQPGRATAPKADRAGAVTKLVVGLRRLGGGKAPAEPAPPSAPAAVPPVATLAPVATPAAPAPAAPAPAAPAQPKESAPPAAATPPQQGSPPAPASRDGNGNGNGSSGGDKGTSGSDPGSGTSSESSSGGGDSAKSTSDPAPPAATPPAAAPGNGNGKDNNANANSAKDNGNGKDNADANSAKDNGNGNGNGNGKDKKNDLPVQTIPAPTPPAPTPPPAPAPPVVAVPPASTPPTTTTQPSTTTTSTPPPPAPPADQGNGNGNGKGKDAGNGNGNDGNGNGNGKKK